MTSLRDKTIAANLSAFLIISVCLPAFSESMWVPRIGYSTVGPKKVYLDAMDPDYRDKENQKENSKDRKFFIFPSGNSEKGLKEKKKTEKEGQKDTKETEENLKAEKEQSKNGNNESQPDRYARRKAQLEAIEAEKMNRPVEGNFFLYDLKQERLIYDQPSKLFPSPDTSYASSYIEFKESPLSGLYDLAVRGSGHRSDRPIWVSDTIYWDALKPVLNDLSKSHCPAEDGKHRVMQQCFQLSAGREALTSSVDNRQKPQIVQGGWYTENKNSNSDIVKSTSEIADLAQLLLLIYEMNPKSYKYLNLSGGNYLQSRYPDILDEANWGLYYLLTIQQENGGFPAGIKRVSSEYGDGYQLMPESPEATAKAIVALAKAVKVFKPEDLSLAVKFTRSAEKGWRYLTPYFDKIDPELLLLSSHALMEISDNPDYQRIFNKVKPEIKTVRYDNAILMSSLPEGMALSETASLAGSESCKTCSALPLAIQLWHGNKEVTGELSQWVTELFGYEQIPLIKDSKLEMASAWSDPLQWVASKTGEMAIRFNYRLEDERIINMAKPKVDSEHLKLLDEKENEARSRVNAGYSKLSLNLPDKVHLAYILTLLNQHMDSLPVETAKGKPAPKDLREEPAKGTIKGFYPKPL